MNASKLWSMSIQCGRTREAISMNTMPAKWAKCVYEEWMDHIWDAEMWRNEQKRINNNKNLNENVNIMTGKRIKSTGVIYRQRQKAATGNT